MNGHIAFTICTRSPLSAQHRRRNEQPFACPDRWWPPLPVEIELRRRPAAPWRLPRQWQPVGEVWGGQGERFRKNVTGLPQPGVGCLGLRRLDGCQQRREKSLLREYKHEIWPRCAIWKQRRVSTDAKSRKSTKRRVKNREFQRQTVSVCTPRKATLKTIEVSYKARTEYVIRVLQS